MSSKRYPKNWNGRCAGHKTPGSHIFVGLAVLSMAQVGVRCALRRMPVFSAYDMIEIMSNLIVDPNKTITELVNTFSGAGVLRLLDFGCLGCLSASFGHFKISGFGISGVAA